MSGLYSARSSFNTYLHWSVFIVATFAITIMLHRMIALASAEEERYGMMTRTSYEEQIDLYRAHNQTEATTSAGHNSSDLGS